MADENLGRAVLALTTDDKDLDKGLDAAERKGHSWVQRVGGLVGKGIKAAAIGAVAAAGITVAALGSTIGPASDLAESASKVGVVFGEQADVVKAFADTAAVALGMSEQEALAAAGTYGNLFRAMNMGEDTSAEMSTSLVQLAADLASFNNMDPTEVLDKLRAGLTGETEPLKTLGVNMNQAALEAKALEMGLLDASGEMSAAAKAQAAYAIIMEQTALAQGDFARTSEGLANQQRTLKAQLGDLRATVGAALLPAIEAIIGKVTELAQSETFQEWIGRLVEGLTVIGEAVGEVVEVITWTLEQGGDLEMVLRNVLSVLLEQLGLTEEQMDGVFEVINKVQDAFLAVTGFIEENATPILAALAAMLLAVVVPAFVTWAGAAITAATATVTALAPVVLPILAIGAAVALLVKAWEKDWGGIRTALTAFWKESGEPVFNAVREWLMVNLPLAIEWIKATIDAALKAIRAWWEENGDALLAKGQATWDAIMGAIDAALAWIQGAIETVTAVIQAIWARYGDDILTVAQTTWDSIQTVIETVTGVIQAVIAAVQAAIAGDWYAFGENLRVAWDTLWEGITTVLSNTLDNLLAIGGIALDALVLVFTTAWDAIKTAVSTVLENLQTSFTEIDWGELGKGIIQGVANGISGAAGIIADAAKRAASAAFEAAKGFLGIESPSKLFAGLGENMMEGVAVGIRNTATRPAVASVQALERTVQQTTNSTTFQIANYAPRVETRLELRHLITALELAHA